MPRSVGRVSFFDYPRHQQRVAVRLLPVPADMADPSSIFERADGALDRSHVLERASFCQPDNARIAAAAFDVKVERKRVSHADRRQRQFRISSHASKPPISITQ
jgi:hypothetical protein